MSDDDFVAVVVGEEERDDDQESLSDLGDRQEDEYHNQGVDNVGLAEASATPNDDEGGTKSPPQTASADETFSSDGGSNSRGRNSSNDNDQAEEKHESNSDHSYDQHRPVDDGSHMIGQSGEFQRAVLPSITVDGWHPGSPAVGSGIGESRGNFSPEQEVGEETPGRTYNSLSFGGDDSPPLAPSEIMRHITPVSGRDREGQAVIDALQDVYSTKLRPIEQLTMFDKFHHDVMSDAELQAKPQVLLLGQYSTGKTTMIRHLIGQDFPAMDIGPEPSAGIFQVVMAGTEERTIKGAALCIVDELPYQGLGAFGASFLGKFQASTTPCELLQHINFVDTPGIIAGEKHGATRGYPFAKVVEWFADRSDLIFLVFDAHKLDMGGEFREVMSAIKQHGDRVRVVLNKAQENDSERLMKVYGALMWSISRCLGANVALPKVYVGSFWDGCRRHPDDSQEDEDSFDLDEAALRKEIVDLPKNVGVRKINDVMQRAKLVKVHLQIIYAVQARMPRLWGWEAAQERILSSLEEVFEEVQNSEGVAEVDMPDVEEYRKDLKKIDFRRLPKRSRRLLSTMDDIIERDIKQCVTRAGGVRRIYKVDSAARVSSFVPPQSATRRRRATTGGDGQGRSGSGASVAGGRRRADMAVKGGSLEEWSSREGSLHSGDEDDDSGLLNGGVREAGSKGASDVPFLLGTLMMVVVVLIGIAMGLWKMGALPAIQEWAKSLNPNPNL